MNIEDLALRIGKALVTCSIETLSCIVPVSHRKLNFGIRQRGIEVCQKGIYIYRGDSGLQGRISFVNKTTQNTGVLGPPFRKPFLFALREDVMSIRSVCPEKLPRFRIILCASLQALSSI